MILTYIAIIKILFLFSLCIEDLFSYNILRKQFSLNQWLAMYGIVNTKQNNKKFDDLDDEKLKILAILYNVSVWEPKKGVDLGMNKL